jgi:hypothetical protein
VLAEWLEGSDDLSQGSLSIFGTHSTSVAFAIGLQDVRPRSGLAPYATDRRTTLELGVGGLELLSD